MEVTAIDQRDPRLCIGHNRAGTLCNKYAMRGQNVCRNHGGSSPQALAKAQAAVELAELRLRNLAPRAVVELESLVTSADSEQVRLQAANSLELLRQDAERQVLLSRRVARWNHAE